MRREDEATGQQGGARGGRRRAICTHEKMSKTMHNCAHTKKREKRKQNAQFRVLRRGPKYVQEPLYIHMRYSTVK